MTEASAMLRPATAGMVLGLFIVTILFIASMTVTIHLHIAESEWRCTQGNNR